MAYTINHFSQANPAGPGQGDIPRLLRTVAATIESLGDVTVSDLIMHTEITADGPWPSITVYYDQAAPTE
ncbi:hypothetical protein JK358_16720 [Nocardia sp. 2]|uniref:Uncharacterized protein n=1 Tax=Nocardia acididurans TaxID=2802282 RepID=A0ABS1MA43_9NOCA|nr:hypothetical protein [Nocardia acididurans]MBL1076043.1 hypothetical protein [Nocardia acididurans]